MNKVSFFSNVNYQILMVILQRLSGLIVNIILAKLLTPQNFGIFALFQRLCETTTSVFRFGLSLSSQVLVAEPESKELHSARKGSLIGTALLVNLIIIFLGSIFLVTFRDYASQDLFQQESISPWLYCLVIFCFFQAFENVLEGILRGFSRFKILGLFNSYVAIGFLVAAPVFTSFFSLKGAIYIVTFIQFIRTIIYVYYTYKALGEEKVAINIKDFIQSLRSHFKIAAPFYAPTLIAAPVSLLLLSFLTEAGGLESMAFLKISVSLGMIVQAIPAAITSVFLSRFAEENDSDNKQRLDDLFLMNIKIVWILSILSSLAILAVLPVIVGYLFGGQYVDVIKSAPYYLPTITIVNIYNIVTSALLARKFANSVMFSNIFCISLWFILGSYLIPTFSLNGYFLTELCGFFLGLVISLTLYVRYLKPNKGFYSTMIKILVINIILFSSFFYLNEVLLIINRIFIFGALGLIILTLSWFSLINKSEKLRMKEIFVTLKSTLTSR
jgi:O-antigen/teichoic acid export membrane protein